MSLPITIYSKSNCPNCESAKRLLAQRGIDYTEISLDDEGRRANFYAAYPGVRQMPQIFAGDLRLGGLASLQAWLATKGTA